MDSDEVKKGFIKSIYESVRNFLKKEWVAKKQFIRRYKFQLALGALFVASIAIMFIYFLFNKEADFINELGNKDKPFYIRNIAVVLAAIATAVFTWWKNTISHKTTEIQESTRQDELFAKAVDLLKRNSDLITRKAGVHILKDLAITSPKHTQKCIDLLCSLNEEWMPKFIKRCPDFFVINEFFPDIKNIDELKTGRKNNNGEDIIMQYLTSNDREWWWKDDIALSQLVLKAVAGIIKHISQSNDFNGEYDLQYKYLCGGYFNNIDFEKFSQKMNGINFNSCDLSGAKLKGASLFEANFDSAKFHRTSLQSANLSLSTFKHSTVFNSGFKDASLEMANFDDAYLKNVNLSCADLEEASFVSAWCEQVDFSSSNLGSVRFDKSKIEKCDFRGIKNGWTTKFGNDIKDSFFSDEEKRRLKID